MITSFGTVYHAWDDLLLESPLVFGLVAGLLFGLIEGLVGGQVGDLVKLLDIGIHPAEALTWSWKKALLGLVGGLGFGLVVGLVVGLVAGQVAGLRGGLSPVGFSEKEEK